MKTVFKYPFSIKELKFSLLMPRDYKFLWAGFQGETPNIWVEVSDVMDREEAHFQLFGTGHEIPDSATYLATLTVGPWVLHLYKL